MNFYVSLDSNSVIALSERTRTLMVHLSVVMKWKKKEKWKEKGRYKKKENRDLAKGLNVISGLGGLLFFDMSLSTFISFDSLCCRSLVPLEHDWQFPLGLSISKIWSIWTRALSEERSLIKFHITECTTKIWDFMSLAVKADGTYATSCVFNWFLLGKLRQARSSNNVSVAEGSGILMECRRSYDSANEIWNGCPSVPIRNCSIAWNTSNSLC